MSTVALLRQLLEETEAPLAAAELELQKVQERVWELQAERYGLQLALARRYDRPADVAQPEPLSATPAEAPTDGMESEVFWQVLSRAEAVERLLERSDAPLTRQELVVMLEQTGRQGDTPDAVSAALAYLQRIDRAARTGRNQWVLAPGPTDA